MFTRERMYLEHIKNIFEICMYVCTQCVKLYVVAHGVLDKLI